MRIDLRFHRIAGSLKGGKALLPVGGWWRVFTGLKGAMPGRNAWPTEGHGVRRCWGTVLLAVAASLVMFSSSSALAQFPWFRPAPEPKSQQATDDSERTAPQEFVAAPDLAAQLKKIDPKAQLQWDGRVLRVEANGQKFSLFPSGSEMVVNGTPEKTARPVRIYHGEIYISQSTIDRIGAHLEKGAGTSAKVTSSPLERATPVSDTIEDTPTPTPTPKPTRTPKPAPPTPQPTETPAPTPEATPTPTPEAEATPTPTPTPSPTPRGKKTPRGAKTEKTPEPIETGNGGLQRALREKADIANYHIPQRKKSELQAMASAGAVTKVVIDADDTEPAGAPTRGRSAKAITLEIAGRLKALLEQKGITVEMTRASEGSVSLGKKLDTITNSGAQALVTISVGASEFGEVDGYRVLFTTDATDYNAYRTPEKEGGDLIPLELTYRTFQDQSKILASALSGSLNRTLKKEPIGINPAPLYLARRAPMASALVVAGYLSSATDAARLADPGQLDAFAAALADGIMQFSDHMKEGAKR